MEFIIGFSSLGVLVIIQIAFFAYGYGKLSNEVRNNAKLINGNTEENKEVHKELFIELRNLERRKVDKQ